jgi:hypothetical protein
MITPKLPFPTALVVLIAGLFINAWAKCPTESVEVSGQLRCLLPDYKVLVTLMFKKKQLEGSAEETALDVHDDSFQGRVGFNSFTSYNPLTGHHQCDRRPAFVLVRLISAEGEEWDRKMLNFPSDFSYNEKDGRYNLRSRIILQGWCKP